MRVKIETQLSADLEKKFLAILEKCFSGHRTDHAVNHMAGVLLEMGIEHYYEKIVLKKEGT